MQPNYLLCGIDIGSTTAKVVILEADGNTEPLFARYCRHNADPKETLLGLLAEAATRLGDRPLKVALTGSAGMGFAERSGLPFIQEVVAATEVAMALTPDTGALLDIGGEDSKLILFQERNRIDIRMNGNCAGGTGAFLDQMAALIGVEIEQMNGLAEKHTSRHTVASRCGVFAKTDVQNLLSQGRPHEDVAAAVLNAVAVQSVNSLVRGSEVRPPLVVSGGPLSYMPFLRASVARALGMQETDLVLPPKPALLTAYGAARSAAGEPLTLLELMQRLCGREEPADLAPESDEPLFADSKTRAAWAANRFSPLPRCGLESLRAGAGYIGIDSGSTTTKMVLMDESGRIASTFYQVNNGEHLPTVARGLDYFRQSMQTAGVEPVVRGITVTGYGEDLVRAALGFGDGLVETVAHLRAAREIAPEVSFVLDIGGQDMKAVTVEQGSVRSIEVNEACSSGCGSFLQTFAATLGHTVSELGDLACRSARPFPLGTRCTVFMGSRVKQALREGAGLEDIAAGLAYAVVRNCLTKVLKLRSADALGRSVVVQGGAFLNPAVHRAFEKLTGVKAVCPEEAGIMGAYGCALAARDQAAGRPAAKPFRLTAAADFPEAECKTLTCRGCTNQCRITRLAFPSGGVFHTGNRCERIFTNGRQSARRGTNHMSGLERLLFDRPWRPRNPPAARIGLPRVLNLFEDLPFWSTLLVEAGFEVVLSAPSSEKTVEDSAFTVMSDSICFPARLVHGHIQDLAARNVDRIFYPNVVYEPQLHGAPNSFNCPIVTGYPDVIRSAMDPERRRGVPLDTPVVSFKDEGLLRSSCLAYLDALKVPRAAGEAAFAKAVAAQKEFILRQQAQCDPIVSEAERAGRTVVLLLCRPYHLDALVHHGIPEMLADRGFDVLPVSYVPDQGRLGGLNVFSQWAYPSRLFNACAYAGRHSRLEVVQLNSFGCGPDAIVCDEVKGLLEEKGKRPTVLRIDENSSPGSLRLRLRTMAETLSLRSGTRPEPVARRTPPVFLPEHRGRTILVPELAPLLTPFLEHEISRLGHEIRVLPPSDDASLRLGLRHVNNEVCYPAILVIGDVLKALASGRYDRNRIAVGISQTGGQCRASNYIALLKKALVSAGYGDVPVVSFNLSGGSLHRQPGFRLPLVRLAYAGFSSLVVADVLMMLERGARLRLAEPRQAADLSSRLTREWLAQNGRSWDRVLDFVKKAVADFRRLPLSTTDFPRVGLVGEIYVKYGDYSNRRITGWLHEQKVDVVVPPLAGFFLSGLVNMIYDHSAHVERQWPKAVMAKVLLEKIERFFERVNAVLADIPWLFPLPLPLRQAAAARQALNLCNQYGEGWGLAGEVLELAERGISDVLCLQPFGCIANQVIAKGVERRLVSLRPDLRLLFLDLDQNTCDANMHNRIHFLVEGARRRGREKEAVEARPAPLARR